jgi:glutamine amidotransferase
MITIIDYGLGNVGSIVNMLKRIGVKSVITSEGGAIAQAQRIILPGVGHFDRAMERIHKNGLRDILEKKALVEKIPLLGICLGMQILTKGSEEGRLPGLGWIPAETVRFRFPEGSKLKIPHMGWNVVERSTVSPLTENFQGQQRFYFVHSYHARVEEARFSILKTVHGYPFDAAIQRDNLYGVQFHPEKSHRFGMQFLDNFARL